MTEQYIEELIRKYAEGIASVDETQKLMEWYSSSTTKEVQWPSVELSEKEVVSQRMLTRLQEKIAPKTGRVIHFPWQKIAAVLLVFFGVATILIFLLKPSRASLFTVANPSGKIQLVMLPDSSKVWLNASTIIRYAKSFKKDRQLKLEGEAYFEVTHDADRPFVIEAGDLTTTVLGTSFNVKAFKEDASTKISVISGKVKVANNSKELGILSPSDELKFDRRNKTRTIEPIDTNNVLAWKNGKLKFNGESFAEIGIVIESWYGVQIKFADASVSRCRYYLSVDNTVPIDTFLSIVSNVADIKYVFDKNKTMVTISGQGCPEAVF
ncbi:MAG TPA: FecR domain-containing protein [Flavitalea sp.]|nr:FecR domain-containing protein [Flavitalea sp.]